jgi:predicted KAP-like P-loop ATPase
MDDIDRLDKEEIQAIFRLVKLTADFPNTVYILSCDIERVAEALAERYGSKDAGKSFLEKIIQLSLPLPSLTPSKLIKLGSRLELFLYQDIWLLPKKPSISKKIH